MPVIGIANVNATGYRTPSMRPLGSRMKTELVTDALRMALWQQQPGAGLIVHSDRGSQYASKAYRRLLKANDSVGSMSRKSDCRDNAVAESFFASLKKQLN